MEQTLGTLVFLQLNRSLARIGDKQCNGGAHVFNREHKQTMELSKQSTFIVSSIMEITMSQRQIPAITWYHLEIN